MGRKRTRNLGLPPGMRARPRKNRTYYYLDIGGTPRKEIALGPDYVAAVGQWAKLSERHEATTGVTFRQAAEHYQRDVLPTKSPRTQKDNLRQLATLYKFFDDPPIRLDQMTPAHVKDYLKWRGKTSLVGANREKALLSHIFNIAREDGLVNCPNPCQGIKGHKEKGRDIYVEDAQYKALSKAAGGYLEDAMDLAYLTGQRPSDVITISVKDIKEGAIWVEQGKTKKKVRIQLKGQLKEIIDRLVSHKSTHAQLLSNTLGDPVTLRALQAAFARARKKVAQDNPDIADEIRKIHFRDLRAKAATDTNTLRGRDAAQKQLGHSTPDMTDDYIRNRIGELVEPTK